MDGRDDRENGDLPGKLKSDEPAPDQRSWQRTVAMESFIEQLAADPEAAIVGFADTVMASALDVTTTADLDLLRNIHHQMQLHETDGKGQISMAAWQKTVFAESTQQTLRTESSRIRAAVKAAASNVGKEYLARGGKAIVEHTEIKIHYLDFFLAVARVFVEPCIARRLLTLLAQSFPEADGNTTGDTLRGFFERALPEGLVRGMEGRGSQECARQRAGRLLTELRSRL